MPAATHQTTLFDFGIVPVRATALQTEPPVYLHTNDVPATEPTSIASVPPAPPREHVPEHDCPGEQAELGYFVQEPAWLPSEPNPRACAICGSSVAPSFARLNRDDDGRIRGCPHCDQTEVSRTDRWGTYEAIGSGELFANGGKDDLAYEHATPTDRPRPRFGGEACCLDCGDVIDATRMGHHLVEAHPSAANRIIANA